MAQLVTNRPANTGDARDAGSIPRLERCPGEGNGNMLQYSCLENHRDRGAWCAAVYGATQSRTRQKRLSGRRAEESEKLSLTLSPFLSEQFGLERVILTSQRLRFPICKLELLPPRLNQGRQCKELSFAKVYANAGGFT